MPSEKDIVKYVQGHPSGKVKIAYADIDGILRGKYIATDKFLSALKGNTTFCDVIFGWDAGDVCYDNVSYTGWHTGYPDTQAQLDINTFRKIPWENDVPFFLGDMLDSKGAPSKVCPRQLLKQVNAQVEKMGFSAVFSQEFEWFNFAETPKSARDKNYQQLQPLTPGMFGYSVLRTTLQQPFFNDLFELLGKFDVPIEGLHTETGPGCVGGGYKIFWCHRSGGSRNVIQDLSERDRLSPRHHGNIHGEDLRKSSWLRRPRSSKPLGSQQETQCLL